MILKTSFLQNIVERVSLINWLSSAVDESEDEQICEVHLISIGSISLKSWTQHNLAQVAVCIIKSCPSSGIQVGPKSLKCDIA